MPGDGKSHKIVTEGIKDTPGEHIKGILDEGKKEGSGNTLTLPGNPKLLAGALVGLTGWGRYDGEWLITESDHTLDVAGGYKTVIKLARES